jgi:hypothetical protein
MIQNTILGFGVDLKKKKKKREKRIEAILIDQKDEEDS